jgi:hypothetical protein
LQLSRLCLLVWLGLRGEVGAFNRSLLHGA